MKTLYQVRVGGIDVSSRLAPYLIALEVNLSDEPASDTARIVLEDADGRLQLPPERATVDITLGTDEKGSAHVFSGFVDTPRGEGARGSGRELHVEAKSADPQGKGKGPKERHFDDTTVGDALKTAGQDAGVTVQVHPDLAAIRRDYLALDGLSFEGFGAQLAFDLGATFKIWGRRALLIPRNAGLSATGKPLTPVTAAVGVNLERWSLSPTRGKPRWKKVRIRTWSAKQAKWIYKDQEAEADADPDFLSLRPADDEAVAEGRAKAGKEDSKRDKGEGSVTIIGEPAAQPGAPVAVSGARPGLDGAYQAAHVRHVMGRSEGFTTTLDLRRPEPGKDTRKKS